MAIDRIEARTWSKDRIREEISGLRRQIAEQEKAIREDTDYYEEVGWDQASPGQLEDMRSKIWEWEGDIEFLESLL